MGVTLLFMQNGPRGFSESLDRNNPWRKGDTRESSYALVFKYVLAFGFSNNTNMYNISIKFT